MLIIHVCQSVHIMSLCKIIDMVYFSISIVLKGDLGCRFGLIFQLLYSNVALKLFYNFQIARGAR